MSIRELINENSVVLKSDITIANAARQLLESKLFALPVVNDEGCYQGMFCMKRLLAMLLPRAVLIEGGVSDLGFVTDPMETLCERMHEQGSRPVEEALDKAAPVAYADTPLLEIVLHLYRDANDIPVVDKQTGRLLGMVTGSDLLAQVCKAENAQ